MQDKRNDDVDSINSDEFTESTCSILRRCTNNTIESLKSFIEGATGFDFDGDGNVGSDWQVHPYDFEANEFHLIIGTVEGGHNSGKNYVHRIANEDAQAWYELIHRQVRLAKEASRQRKIEEKYGTSRYSMYRAIVHRAYTSNTFQYSVAFVIVFAFFLDMVEAQILPARDSIEFHQMFVIDIVITTLFTIELCINIFAHSNHGFRPFYLRLWNWFDVTIVAVSLFNVIVTASGQQGANFKMLRLLRLGRAVRLFSALKDLNRLIMAVSSALYPVCNAFLILFITSCVYGVLGTNFFREMEPEYFENFLTSLFTMFQVLTGDSWASAVSRTLFINHNRGKTNYAIAFFFISYILICSVMLLNVVIAVLLDEFISSVTREREEEQRLAEIEINKRKVVGPLDPLTKDLITFEDEGDLSKKVAYLYHKLDEDESGGLNFDEFQHGLKLLKANIHLTREDFDIVTGLVNLF